MKSGLEAEIDAVSAAPDFGPPTQKWFPWNRTYQRSEWLDQLVSRSDHAALEPSIRDRLFDAIGAAIDDHGGSFVMDFETVMITATRLASPRDQRSTTPPRSGHGTNDSGPRRPEGGL